LIDQESRQKDNFSTLHLEVLNFAFTKGIETRAFKNHFFNKNLNTNKEIFLNNFVGKSFGGKNSLFSLNLDLRLSNKKTSLVCIVFQGLILMIWCLV